MNRIAMLVLTGGLLMQQAAFADSFEHLKQAAEARDQQQQQEQRDRGRGGRHTPGDAARIAQERNGGGRVIRVLPTEQGHRVKILKGGEVRELMVPDDQ